MNELEMRWKACFSSILSVSPYPILVAAVAAIGDNDGSYFILMSVGGVPIYLIYSLLGWVFIGMPINRALTQYPDWGLPLNVVSSTAICFLLYLLFREAIPTLLFGIPILVQPVAFWLYFRRYSALSQARSGHLS